MAGARRVGAAAARVAGPAGSRGRPTRNNRDIAEALDKIKVTDLRGFIERFEQAWQQRKAQAVAACCHQNTIWEDPSIPEPVLGRDGVAAHVITTLSAFSDLAFVPDGDPAISTEKTIAYWPWRMIGSNDGPIDPPGFPATGRSIDVPGVNIWKFSDGLLLYSRAVYDRADMARQLGLMPAPRSRAEQVYVTMAQLRSRMPNG